MNSVSALAHSCRALAGVIAAAVLFSNVPAALSQTDPIAALYNDGNVAFAKGDFKTAVQKFDQVIKLVPPDSEKQLESLYFTRGAAYFNLKQYAKAVEGFKQFISKFKDSKQLVEAKLAIAQSYFLLNEWEGAGKAYKELQAIPKLRDQAFLYEGMAHKESKKIDEAIATYEQLIEPGLKSRYAAEGAMNLVDLYGEKRNADKAKETLFAIQNNIGMVDNLVRLNAITLKLGDDFLQPKSDTQPSSPREALGFYRAVRPKNEIIQMQRDRIATYKRQFEGNVKVIRANPQVAAQYLNINTELSKLIQQNETILDQFEKLGDYYPGVLFRIGRCFYDMNKKWEATIVYREILDRYKDYSEREATLFGLIVSTADLKIKLKEVLKLCEEYLKESPQGQNVSTVGYIAGAMAFEAEDYALAESTFMKMLKDPTQEKSEFRSQMQFMLAAAQFQQGKFDEGEQNFKKYVDEYPTGDQLEDAYYQVGIARLFQSKYETAIAQFNAYLAKFPGGAYVPDVKYRLGICTYATQINGKVDYDKVIADMTAWKRQYGSDLLLGEVNALLGDAYIAKGKEEEAAKAYYESQKAAASKEPINDEVLNYSIMAAAKLYQKFGEYDEISKMFREFVQLHPEHFMVPTAVFWIAKTEVRKGEADKAKVFIAQNIKKYIDDPKRETVEMLLTQLAQLVAKPKPPRQPAPVATPARSTAPGAPASVTAAATPAPAPKPDEPYIDPNSELENLLGSVASQKSHTAEARIFFAQAELAKARRQFPESTKLLMEIARYEPEALSAMMLAFVGDFMREHGRLDKAQAFYEYLQDHYPKSDFVDFAYAGLGELAYNKGDYQTALKYFTDGMEKVFPNLKFKEMTIGQAKALFGVGKLDEAMKLFNTAAANRQWRDQTAYCLYMMGEIEMKRGDYPKAIAYYQRVYVAYRKYIPWVCKSYVKSAECFEKLGKAQEAKNTYMQMVLNNKLQSCPEYAEAKKRLEEMK